MSSLARGVGLLEDEKPRPISFGGVLSRSPMLNPPSTEPRRSMSTRISDTSNQEHSEGLSRPISPSLGPFREPSRSPAPSERSGFPTFVDTSQSIDDLRDNINSRFSQFSFGPSLRSASARSSNSDEGPPAAIEDGQVISRFGSVSTSSEYPPGSSKKVKSPPPGHRAMPAPPGSDIPPSIGVESSMLGYSDDESIEDGIMVAGESERGSKISLPLARKILLRKETRGSTSATEESRQQDTPDIIVQSPIAPQFAHVKEEPKSPRAEKTLRVPFLHRFKVKSTSGESKKTPAISAPVSNPHLNQPHSHHQVNSLFDNASSDGDSERGDGERAFFGEARKVQALPYRNPVIVHNSTSSQLGIKEILSRGPSVQGGGISPQEGEGRAPARTLDPSSMDERRADRRSGILGWPESEHKSLTPQTAGATISTYEDGDERVSGLWGDGPASDPLVAPRASTEPVRPPGPEEATREEQPQMSRLDGLRSHPTVSRRPVKRKVTFPIDTARAESEGQGWVREDLTPYPVGYKSKEEKDGEDEEAQQAWNLEWKATLTLVVYAHANRVPRLKRLAIPTVAHEIPIATSSSASQSEPQAKAIMNRDFDDATLFNLLRISYTSLRGTFISRFSARTVCGIRLLGYEKECQLATHRAKHRCFEEEIENKDEEAGFAELRLLELYRDPKQGKGRWQWWGWVRGLPENKAAVNQRAVTGGGIVTKQKVALELVEGWSARRIVAALALVALCSFIATLLWIFAGGNALGGSGIAYPATEAQNGMLHDPIVSSPRKSSTKSGGVAITASSAGEARPTGPAPAPTDAVPTATTVPPVATNDADAEAYSQLVTRILGLTIGPPGATPTVMQRDTARASATSEPSAVGDKTGESSTTPARLDQLRGYSTSSPASRVGAGVGLGVLVLLFGWMAVGGWIALSWML